MSDTVLTVLALAVALVSAAWAGLLGLAEEARAVARTISEEASKKPGHLPLYRALHFSRLALLIISGIAAAQAVGWWYRPLPASWATALVSAAFLYLVADALPRTIGSLVPELSAAAVGLATRSLVFFRPLLEGMAAVERGVNRLLPSPKKAAEILGPAQRDILLGVFALGDTTVAEVMTPRLDIAAVEADLEWPELVERLRRSEHARLPVYDGTLDDLVGILYAKDLVPAVAGVAPPPERWQDFIRPAQFVPESKTLASQLKDFQKGPSHLAIVVDEFGGTSGLLTLEDILEEVVGEIRGEYDAEEEPAIEQEGEDRFWVDGRVSLDELSEVLGSSFEKTEVNTVGGLIYSELGRVPAPGEELVLGGFRVVVERVVGRRIRRVFFERLPSGAGRGGAQEEEGR
jgi:CBS domain containing-hemolysin-like protein